MQIQRKVWRPVLILLAVSMMAVGVTAVSITHDAVTGTEEVAEAWEPWPGFDLECVVSATVYGLTAITPLWAVTTPITAFGSFLLRAGSWAGLFTSVYECRDMLRYFYSPSNNTCAFGSTAYNYPYDFNGNIWYDAGVAYVPKFSYQHIPCGWTPAQWCYEHPYAVGCGGGGGGGGSW